MPCLRFLQWCSFCPAGMIMMSSKIRHFQLECWHCWHSHSANSAPQLSLPRWPRPPASLPRDALWLGHPPGNDVYCCIVQKLCMSEHTTCLSNAYRSIFVDIVDYSPLTVLPGNICSYQYDSLRSEVFAWSTTSRLGWSNSWLRTKAHQALEAQDATQQTLSKRIKHVSDSKAMINGQNGQKMSKVTSEYLLTLKLLNPSQVGLRRRQVAVQCPLSSLWCFKLDALNMCIMRSRMLAEKQTLIKLAYCFLTQRFCFRDVPNKSTYRWWFSNTVFGITQSFLILAVYFIQGATTARCDRLGDMTGLKILNVGMLCMARDVWTFGCKRSTHQIERHPNNGIWRLFQAAETTM